MINSEGPTFEVLPDNGCMYSLPESTYTIYPGTHVLPSVVCNCLVGEHVQLAWDIMVYLEGGKYHV